MSKSTRSETSQNSRQSHSPSKSPSNKSSKSHHGSQRSNRTLHEEEEEEEARWEPKGIMALTNMFPLAVGPGTAHSASEKLKVLKVAAGRDKGKSCGMAWYRLGMAHLEGEGTAVDQRQALHCFEMAADRHNVKGALQAGKLLFEGGPGFRQNKDRARYFLNKAAEGGVPDAQRRLGELNLSTPNQEHSETLQFFLDAFTTNPIVNAAAGMAAGRMMSAGMSLIDGKPDYQQACRLLNQAADAGAHGPARLRLAVMYELGTGGVEKDAVKARAFWKLAIISDVAEAHYRVAVLTLHGAGFVKSERAAVNGFRRAARLGFLPFAADRLGELRGQKAVDEIESHRNAPPDFVDIKYQQTLYPYPFYDDEIKAAEIEDAEAEARLKAALDERKAALVKAMLTGGQRAVDKLKKKFQEDAIKEKALKAASCWELPDILVKYLGTERSELMSCINTYEHHMPTRYEPPPPPPEDKVRNFYKNMGISGLGHLSTIPLQNAIVGLNGEGLGEHCFGEGMEAYRNGVFEEQVLEKKLGLLRKTSTALGTRPVSKGHSNLLDLESRMFSANSRYDTTFLSAGAVEENRLKNGRKKTASILKLKDLDEKAVVSIAKGSTSKQVMTNRRIEKALKTDILTQQQKQLEDETKMNLQSSSSFPSPFQRGLSSARSFNFDDEGGSELGSDVYPPSSSHLSYAPPVNRRGSNGSIRNSIHSVNDGGGVNNGQSNKKLVQIRKNKKKSEEVPAWMYDNVWMSQPKTDASLFRAVELRRNYGAPPRLGTAKQNQARNTNKHRSSTASNGKRNGSVSGGGGGGGGSSDRGSSSHVGSYETKTEGGYTEYSSAYSSSYQSSYTTSRATSTSGRRR